MPRTTLLALNPGTREVGYAVFADHELIDQGVKSLRRSPPFQDRAVVLSRALSALLQERPLHLVALARTSSSDQRVDNRLQQIYAVAVSLALRRNVSVYAFPPALIGRTVTRDVEVTKRAVARAAVEWYPQLRRYVRMQVEWRERYFFQLFDAVACGMTFLTLDRMNQLDAYAI